MFQSANKRLKLFFEGISCIRLQYSVVFWRNLINCSMSLTSEMRGMAPHTYGLLSGRSTIWPLYLLPSNLAEVFFRSVSNYEIFLFVRRKSTHLTFIYITIKSRGSFFSLSQQLFNISIRSQKIYSLGISICNRLSAVSNYQLRSCSCICRCGASIPVPFYHLSFMPMV